ncbi:DUF4352 domain-containing protein [Leifsonia sp. Root112D2]|uniref:DUF4352 domain-containing protein n=1 Tax=Leifsonia sp. Root112D2 TaxID=1736426 RepID=UPI0006F577C6|nr:DUF4352 domain-containing protein [Leifsonia sp. Root112D2]KQV07008.1 hypothetical protein ASC63_06595 [Leifsonia sp. Root112D2]
MNKNNNGTSAKRRIRGGKVGATAIFVASTTLCAIVLTGCVSQGEAAPQPSGAASTPYAGHSSSTPIPEPTSTTRADPSVGFNDTGSGAPVIKRTGELSASKRAKAPIANFTTPAVFEDGVAISTSRFSRGTVTSTGTGIVTGAPFIVFTVTLKNGSLKTLDLASVVLTLRYADGLVAAPLYTDVPARDFSGTVAPGSTKSAVYAFQVPKPTTKAVLYVDLDGAHTPAEFSGSFLK